VEACYKGDYIFQRSSAEVPEGLDLSSIEPDELEYLLAGKGFVCKDGYLFRIRCEFDNKPERRELDPDELPEGSPEGLVAVSHHDYDNATNGEVYVYTYPLDEQFSCVSVGLVDDESLEQSILRRPSIVFIDAPPNPPMPVPGTMDFPLEPPHDPTDFIVERLGDDRVRLSMQFEDDPSSSLPSRRTYSVEWWLGPEVPVIERAHLIVERLEEGEHGYELELRYSNFRDCDGLLIPANVTDLGRGLFMNEDGSPNASAHLTQWICANLGELPPTDKDFAIPVDPVYAVIGGVMHPMRFRDAAEISVVELTVDDVPDPGEDPEARARAA
jgi:hypothetical protein